MNTIHNETNFIFLFMVFIYNTYNNRIDYVEWWMRGRTIFIGKNGEMWQRITMIRWDWIGGNSCHLEPGWLKRSCSPSHLILWCSSLAERFHSATIGTSSLNSGGCPAANWGFGSVHSASMGRNRISRRSSFFGGPSCKNGDISPMKHIKIN